MKSKSLQSLNAASILTLFAVFLSFLLPMKSVAQVEYTSDKGTVIGTSDSRLFASVYETSTTVTMKVMAIGAMEVDIFDFSIFYDPTQLQLLDTTATAQITLFGPQPKAAKLSSALKTKGWICNPVHKKAQQTPVILAHSCHEEMAALWIDCGVLSSDATKRLVLTEGQVETLAEVVFEKVSPNRDLAETDFGLAISTENSFPYQTKFGAEGLFVWYRDVTNNYSIDKREINPNAFLYRSGQELTTNSPIAVSPSTATLSGSFVQGLIPVFENLVDVTGTSRTGDAKLYHDAVKEYGFLYSEEDLEITIDEFSKLIVINGTAYPLPLLNAGVVTIGAHTLYLVIAGDNNGVDDDKTYSYELTDLQPDHTYYAWAYDFYTFETSETFQAVGERITFRTSDCIPLNIGTVFTAYEPSCGAEDGKIYVSVTGGSGQYKFSTDGENFETYPENIITGLAAGVYTIWVEDALQSCPGTSIGNIVLHNAFTDLSVYMTASNASTCDPQSGNGILYVSVTGGMAEYIYTLNGAPVNVVNGMITDKPVGIYVLEVTDGLNCVATTGEVRISADNTPVAIAITNTQNTECGSANGAATITVTGLATFTYQLDGYPEVTDATSPIQLTGLTAGKHTIHVYGTCGEATEEIEIWNTNNGLAFDYTSVNETIDCFGELVAGSITLNVTTGNANFKYRINGGSWLDFDANAFTVTLPELSFGIYRVEVKDATECTFEINKITIGREVYEPVTIGTLFVAQEPTCGQDNGAIQIYATGGSGAYVFSLDNVTYKSYTNGLINELSAGTYTIWVKDANNMGCNPASVNNIVLHNSGTDLDVMVSATNAQTCESRDGILHVTVTGGTPDYRYYINEISPANEVFLTNGNITGQPAGVYVVFVVDASNCTATSAEVRIEGNASLLAITEVDSQDATCGSSTGSYTFTVNGTTNFTYHLDGNPAVTVNPYSGAEIILNGLNAGEHTLYVYDACGADTATFIIGNGTNGIAFTILSKVNEILSCEDELIPGSVNIEVTGGAGNYEYSINGGTWVAFNGNTYTIEDLHEGIYLIEVKDKFGCKFEINDVVIDRETSFGTLITPPVATTPQAFCENATVVNLQAIGTGIKWYDETGNLLAPNVKLVDGAIYYAAQSVGTCESQVRTAVKVIIDSEVELDAPVIADVQTFCQTNPALTLADIATDGNTNIVWYNAPENGQVLNNNTPLTHGTTYYAAIKAGDCESALRTEVLVMIDENNVPVTPDVTTPQSFCQGAVVANLAVPHNQIVWYLTETGGEPLAATDSLKHNTLYYASYKTGGCESANRAAVRVYLTQPEAPDAPTQQAICGKATIADLEITGAGIVWFDADGKVLPLTTELEPNTSYFAAQSSSNNCEGARLEITITNNCYVVDGTMFPFVNDGAEAFYSQFPVTVTLFEAPADNATNPFATFNNPVAVVGATHYDGSVFIPGTPRNPGAVGASNNPGLPIDWTEIGRTIGTVDTETVDKGEAVDGVGMFTFENLLPGKYILQIERAGFLIRWAEIEVTTDAARKSLGHRELIAGDVNKDWMINFVDASYLNMVIGNGYQAAYDFDANEEVSESDRQIMLGNMNAYIKLYLETKIWLEKYGY